VNDTPAERGAESWWGALRRRKVVQWSVAYAAGAWVLLQVLDFAADAFGWPAITKPLAMLGAAIGLPVVATLAWFHGERSQQRVTGRELAILTALLLVGGGLIWWEARTEDPMIDLELFSSRTFSAGISSATLAYLALFAMTFTMPFYLLRVLGLDTRVAGLVLTVTPLAMALVAPLAGRTSDRLGSRGLATAGTVILAAGLFGASFVGRGSSTVAVMAALAVIGTGMALFQTPNTAAVLRATPRARAGIGSAFVGEARNVGMTIGIALTAAVVGAALGGVALPATEGLLPPRLAEGFVTGMSNALRLGAAVALLAAALSWFGHESDTVEQAGPST